jgi:hypothetical protein
VFSFIKSLQNLLSELKKRKGLWFTTLSLMSMTGILLSMYLLTTMTSSIAEEVYANMSVTYKNTLEEKIEDKQKELRKVVMGLRTNDTFKNNLNNKQVIDPLVEAYNKSLVEIGFDSISLSFYSTINQTNQYRNIINTVINRKTGSFGIEILGDGPNLVYLEPVVSGENVLGVIEIKENLLSLKKDFERNKQSIFVFLIQEKMMNNLAIDAKNGRYRAVVDDLRVEEQKYDGAFFSNVIEEGLEGFKELKNNGYIVNKDFFKTYKEIVDINGVTVGYVLVGEKVEGSGGFVSIVDNMTKSVTMIALGLVIAILLFMF